MEFFPDGAAYLAMALPNVDPMLLRLHAKTIAKGRYDFLFREERGKYEIRIQGRGVADEDSGQLSGKLVLKLDPPPDSSWSVRFMKLRGEPYTERIYDLSQAAKRVIPKRDIAR